MTDKAAEFNRNILPLTQAMKSRLQNAKSNVKSKKPHYRQHNGKSDFSSERLESLSPSPPPLTVPKLSPSPRPVSEIITKLKDITQSHFPHDNCLFALDHPALSCSHICDPVKALRISVFTPLRSTRFPHRITPLTLPLRQTSDKQGGPHEEENWRGSFRMRGA
jgi:hypothetical protein